MTTTNGKSDTCPTCGKGWNTHHTLASVINEKVSIHCHADGIPDTEDARGRNALLMYILKTRAEKKDAQSELLQLKQQTELDKQASEAELKRKFESKVEVTANKKLAEALTEVEAENKKTLEESLEKTRVQLTSSHEARVLDLKAQLTSADGAYALLSKEKADLAASLAASEAKSVELQTQVDEMSRKVTLFGRLERALRKCRYEFRSMGIGSFSQQIRIGHLEAIKCRYEKLYGPLPDEPSQTLEEMLESIEDDGEKDEIGREAAPTPVPTPAPKADVATKAPANGTTAAAPKAAPAPVQPVASKPQMTVLDDDTDDGHEVGNDDVVAEHDAGSDDESDEVECSACDKKAGYVLLFTAKDGKDGRLTSCLPNAHGKEFLSYLQTNAKGSHTNASDVALLFENLNA